MDNHDHEVEVKQLGWAVLEDGQLIVAGMKAAEAKAAGKLRAQHVANENGNEVALIQYTASGEKDSAKFYRPAEEEAAAPDPNEQARQAARQAAGRDRKEEAATARK